MSTAFAAVLAAVVAWAGPPGSDFAAHSYQRAVFLQHGFTLWNNFWYAGRYSFVTYSALYYPLAAIFGIRLLAVSTVALAALAFTVVLWREWGPTTRWSSRSFAVVWTGVVLAAAFPFALGAAFLLLALWALQVRASWRFAALALLTLASSPLAFALLVLLGAGIALGKRADWGRLAPPLAALALVGAVGVLLWRLFPDNGQYPFTVTDLTAVCIFSGIGAALIWRVERARALLMILLVYGAACVAVFLTPSVLGSNIIRLQYLAVPVAVLVASLRGWRPLWACLIVVALAAAWNAKPLIRSVAQDAENPAARQSYWEPAVRYLQAHLSASYRVEAVDTVGHWPALYLPAAGIPLVRGWFRQDDFPTNAPLYRPLTSSRYLAWLRALGVRYVVLSRAEPDYSALGEAELLQSGRSGLTVVKRTRDLAVFSVPRPAGILSGADGTRVLSYSQTGLVLGIPRRGRYRLAVRYSPYSRPSSGCLLVRKDGMTEVISREPGRLTVSFDFDPRSALAVLAGRVTRVCAGVTGGS